jgi:hypothetical protein
MSNQVYKNSYNGGNKYFPQITKNVYQLQNNESAPNTNYGVSWNSLKFDYLNGANVPGVTNSGVTTLIYNAKPATLNEIRPASISNVDGGNTWFYVLQSGNYHIEYNTVWTDVAGTNFIGILTQTYDPSNGSWNQDEFFPVNSGLQNAVGNPLIVSLNADINLNTNQRFQAAYQVSNTVTIISDHANIAQTYFAISKNA